MSDLHKCKSIFTKNYLDQTFEKKNNFQLLFKDLKGTEFQRMFSDPEYFLKDN